MAMLHEWQVNVTTEQGSGNCMAYILEDDGDGQWKWLADQDFGPFDTAQDIVAWIVRVLSARMDRPMR